ncbi:MAG: hypothetical protein ACI8PW_000062 [Methylophilaceae bacterium]|jgi:hypothetical protein
MSEWITVARTEEITPDERLVKKVDDAQVVDQRDRNQGYATYRFLLLDALY